MLNHVRTARRARQVVATTTVRVRAGGRVPTARKSALARIMGRGYRVVAITNAHARVVGAAPTAPTLQLAATITLASIMRHAHRVVATTVVPARIEDIIGPHPTAPIKYAAPNAPVAPPTAVAAAHTPGPAAPKFRPTITAPWAHAIQVVDARTREV